jgi:hypothetical protein
MGLLARAWAVRFDDREAAITLTDLARIAAKSLKAKGYSDAQVADFTARAWGEHANALRAGMRLAEAERALSQAMGLAVRRRGGAARMVQSGQDKGRQYAS